MASELNVNKTQILLNSVVFSNSLPDFWNPGIDKLTYDALKDYCSGLGIDLLVLICFKEETHKNFELNNCTHL